MMMIHLTGIAWAQFILIEVGVLFQLVALCAVIKETSAYRRKARLNEVAVDEDQQSEGMMSEDMEFQTADQAEAAQTDSTSRERADEDAPMGIKTCNLSGIATKKFVQKFEFRRHGT